MGIGCLHTENDRSRERRAAVAVRLSFWKSLCRIKSPACVRAGELEGTGARLEWNQMPREPCCVRLPVIGAGTFAPLCAFPLVENICGTENVLMVGKSPMSEKVPLDSAAPPCHNRYVIIVI